MKNLTKKASASETERVLKVKKSGVGLEKARYRAFYAIMAPFIFFFLLSKGYPLVWGLYISFTNFTGFNLDNLTFVGLANFKRVFVDNEAFAVNSARNRNRRYYRSCRHGNMCYHIAYIKQHIPRCRRVSNAVLSAVGYPCGCNSAYVERHLRI